MTEFFGWLSSGEGAGILGVGLVSLLVGYVVGLLRGAAHVDDPQSVAYWQRRADYWMQRAVRAEDSDFPRPMGARRPEDVASLSTGADVAELRAWRQRRAVMSRDHLTRHGIDDIPNSPANDSWAAHEILRFIGGVE